MVIFFDNTEIQGGKHRDTQRFFEKTNENLCASLCKASVPLCVKNKTATIGFFDGVHLGHRFVIKRLKEIAERNNSSSLIITFGTHPRKTLQSDFQPKLLTTLPEKLKLLDETGVDACAVLDFTPEVAQLSAYDFMKQVLKEQYNVSTLLIGYDHRFGNNRHETFENYAEYGKTLNIEVVLLEQFLDDETEHISSSEIRKALQNGQIERANAMLGYNYFFEGKVIDGFKIGRKIGFPTANLQLDEPEKLLPAIGVYAVKILADGKNYSGMLNIGNRPTLENGNAISIEAHIINFDRNIYNQTIEVGFIQKIRDERKFDSVNELIEQLTKDREMVLGLGF